MLKRVCADRHWRRRRRRRRLTRRRCCPDGARGQASSARQAGWPKPRTRPCGELLSPANLLLSSLSGWRRQTFSGLAWLRGGCGCIASSENPSIPSIHQSRDKVCSWSRDRQGTSGCVREPLLLLSCNLSYCLSRHGCRIQICIEVLLSANHKINSCPAGGKGGAGAPLDWVVWVE